MRTLLPIHEDIPFGPDDSEEVIYPQERSVPETIADLDNVILLLEAAEPKVAEGRFRWPHHGCFSRNRVHVELPHELIWREIDRMLIARPDLLSPRLVACCARHAWEVGVVISPASIDLIWPQLDPLARGRVLAGASNDCDGQWPRHLLPDAGHTPETLLEIACCALRVGDVVLMEAVMKQGAALLTHTVRRMEPMSDGQWSDESRWAPDVARLSHRVVDMILESVVTRPFPAGMRLALEHGADPNLRIWQLERSFNHWQTTVSLPLREWVSSIHDDKQAEKSCESALSCLSEHPQFAKGPRHFPALMIALQRDMHGLCERLLEAGVAFEAEEVPGWATEVTEGGDVDWSRCYWLWTKEHWDTATRLSAAVPLIPAAQAEWYHDAGAQGGVWLTPLSLLLKDKDLKHLIRYAAAGLPIRPTFQDCVLLVKNRSKDTLAWLLNAWQIAAPKHSEVLQLLS